jgi:hypothetical protein
MAVDRLLARNQSVRRFPVSIIVSMPSSTANNVDANRTHRQKKFRTLMFQNFILDRQSCLSFFRIGIVDGI